MRAIVSGGLSVGLALGVTATWFAHLYDVLGLLLVLGSAAGCIGLAEAVAGVQRKETRWTSAVGGLLSLVGMAAVAGFVVVMFTYPVARML